MPLSGRYWSDIFRWEFVPQLRQLVDALERRVLPGFAGIEQEAEKATQDAWEAMMSMPAVDEGDPAGCAEAAQDVGVQHYMLLNGVRQGIINLFASALYHAFEQQVMLFHRRQVLHPTEENESALFKFSIFIERLKWHGIEVVQFESWAKVQELRLVANAVKHAEGNSANELRRLRPDLFNSPAVPFELVEATKQWRRPLFQPLVGDDLYVSLADLSEYRDALVRFWSELAEALQAIAR